MRVNILVSTTYYFDKMSRTQLSSICRNCQRQITLTNSRRTFSTTTTRLQTDESEIFQQALREPTANQVRSPAQQKTPGASKSRMSKGLESLAEGARAEATTRPGSSVSIDEPYHLNVYAHKHNVHITFTEPSRNPILSFSAGNIGLRKAQRGTFDAAYQLATYTFRKMAEKQWRTGGKGATFNPMLTLNEVEVKNRGIEILLRGFGPGREAFQKALLGTEGKIIKPLINKVTDGTRLKFGGTRSRAVRRLG